MTEHTLTERRAIGTVDACPICGERLQAHERLVVEYDHVTWTMHDDGRYWLDDVEVQEDHQETTEFLVYCFNDHTAEEMEKEYRKRQGLDPVPVE